MFILWVNGCPFVGMRGGKCPSTRVLSNWSSEVTAYPTFFTHHGIPRSNREGCVTGFQCVDEGTHDVSGACPLFGVVTYRKV